MRGPVSSLLLFAFVASVHAQIMSYFVVTRPSASSSWANGSPYPISWSKGLLDGIDSFDIELTRLSEEGLFYVAKNVPSTYSTLNVYLEDVPESDDYFVICLNSTNGMVYSVSNRFSVTNATATKNPSPDPAVPTVTISGTPTPTQNFAATLAATSGGGRSLLDNSGAFGFGSGLVLCAVFFGGVMAVW